MINPRLIIATAALASLAGCSRTDQSNEQVQAANTATPMENMHNQMMANGMMANGMMENGMMGGGMANNAASSSGMPADSNAAVNEHLAHHENKSD